MKIDFEKYLQEEFSDEHPEILDDNQPDAFTDWVEGLDPDDWFRLGNQYVRKMLDKKYTEVLHPCPCGSGLESEWQTDARGFSLCRTCENCHNEQMKRYRPDVLSNPNYYADEQIEPEE